MRILILTSSTGGGHDLRANAFCLWARRYPDLDISAEIFRPLEASGWHYQIGVDFYAFIQRAWPRFHHVYWNFLEWLDPFKSSARLIGVRPLVEKFQEYDPDIVLSVHPQLSTGFFELLRGVSGTKKVRFVNYCGHMAGGYGFSAGWVDPTADLFIGATDACCEQALKLGMPESKTVQGGYMLRPPSHRGRMTQADRHAYLSGLGMQPDIFTLLLATGAHAANNHEALLREIDRAGLSCQAIALCGNGRNLLERLSRRNPSNGVRVKAVGYTEEMPDLLASADAVVTRGGAGTTSEAVIAGCMPVMNQIGGTMPQEYLTVRYLKTKGLHRPVARPGDIVPILARWLDQPETFAADRQALADAVPPGSPRQILERLRQCVESN